MTLVGIMELAIYGSRVDNTYDNRLVREYLSLFFRSDVLQVPRKKSAGGLEIPPFDIPSSTVLADFRAKVEQLPDLDNPQTFGMSPNADRSLQRINSTRVISMLRYLASATAAGSGDSGGGASSGS